MLKLARGKIYLSAAKGLYSTRIVVHCFLFILLIFPRPRSYCEHFEDNPNVCRNATAAGQSQRHFCVNSAFLWGGKRIMLPFVRG